MPNPALKGEPEMTDNVNFTQRLPAELNKKVAAEARQFGRSKSKHIEKVLEERYANREPKATEARKRLKKAA